MILSLYEPKLLFFPKIFLIFRLIKEALLEQDGANVWFGLLETDVPPKKMIAVRQLLFQ